ncbi:MAG: HAD-IC family P-type ATPase, partial [Actinomycetota bacterium]
MSVPHTPPDPWSLPAARVAEVLDADLAGGLTTADAASRLARFGPNALTPEAPVPRWRKLANHFINPVVYLLLAAIVISVGAWLVEGGEGVPLDAIVIAAIVVLNAAMGYVQEHRAEAAVAALRALTRAEATVTRDGGRQRIDAADVVVGDLLELSEGDVVPADGRLIDAKVLRVAEAALTGESEPVTKSVDAVEADAVLGDRTAMVHSGTVVTSGRARAIVTATGDATEVGRIATLLTETETESTPLSDEIDRVGRFLGLTVVVIAVGVVGALVLSTDDRSASSLTDALLIGVSLAVAAVPEGLPAVLTVVLALGVQRMSKRNALIKRLASVETLGSATVICSDKTGTLTRNEMTVRRLALAPAEIELTGSGFGSDGSLRIDGVGL